MDVPWYAGHGGCLVVRLMGAIEVFFGCATRPICNTIASYDAEKDTTEMLNTDHLTSEYYRNVRAFNSKNSDFFDTYRRNYIDTEEQTQALMDAIENIHDKPTIDNIAKRFGVKNVVGDEPQSPMTSTSKWMCLPASG